MTFANNEQCTVKILIIKPGEKLSLQTHTQRDEAWYVISGEVRVRTGQSQDELSSHTLTKGGEIAIPRESFHDAENVGSSPVEILEVSTGHFDENDIQRVEDRYGRA